MTQNRTGKHLQRKDLSPEESMARTKAAFLADLRQQVDQRTYNVSAAARAASYARNTFYRWRESDPAFAAEWDEISDTAVDMLEQVAMERATTTSDILLIFLLKAMRPDKYRDQVRHELSGPSGGPIPFSYGALIAEVEAGSVGDSEG